MIKVSFVLSQWAKKNPSQADRKCVEDSKDFNEFFFTIAFAKCHKGFNYEYLK